MKRIFLLATIALALWGCSEERFIEENPSTGGVVYDPAKIVTVITDMEETRGTPILSATNIPDMGLFCSYTGTTDWAATDTPNKMFNTQLTQTSGAWVYTGSPVSWDAASAGDKYTFFAYSPYASATNGIAVTSTAATAGIPTLTYNVPTTVAEQPDLIVAVPKKDVNPYSTVPLQMKHALTCVEFQIAGSGEMVTDISITGVYMAGSLNMDASNMSWATSGALSTTSLSALLNTDVSGSYTTTPTMSTNLMKGDGYLMMVPQTLQAGAKVTVTYSNGTVLDFALTGTWTAGERRTYKITTEVMVSPCALVIPHTGTDGTLNNIEVTTSQPGIKWTLQTAASWLKLGLLADGSDKGSSVNGTGDQIVYTFADPNATAANRATTITINGTANEVVKVTQLYAGGGLNVLPNFYIGAFWRAGETGERILRKIDNTTPWVVSILWMDDNWTAGDILLAPGLNSTYVDFAAVNSSPGNAESYQVLPADAKTSLSGTDAIEFRVGLTTKWDATNSKYSASIPARYAVLVLSHGTSYGSQQKIFLRQGHEADYVMRNGDAAGSESGAGWNGTRTICVKFNPYNLTSPNYKPSHASYVGDAFTGTNVTNHATIPARATLSATDASDYFTDYPTQAGAFFQWAKNVTTTLERKAYHPTKPVGAITTGWNNTNSENYFWTSATNPYSVNSETCPPGWRRPTDGVTDVEVPSINTGLTETNNNIHNSEIRQSLWLNPQNTNGLSNERNSVFGYYADGYFDRRAIENSGSTVASTSSIPAYRGRLFFNQETSASLFFPAAGYRASNNGQFNNAGTDGWYWTSSALSLASAWGLYVSNSWGYQRNNDRSSGFSIRCVPGPIDPSVTVDDYTESEKNLKD